MSGRNPTPAEIAQRETSAAAGFALNEIARARMIVTGTPDAPTQAALQDMAHHAAEGLKTATCIGCGCDVRHTGELGRFWLRLDRDRGVGVCSACDIYREPWDLAHAFGPPHLDLVAHLYRQREFSRTTFGPGPRTNGVITHIRKELIEIEEHPSDLMEWIDVVMLALDGAWRAGHEPAAIALALATKLTRNELRTWPDWRTVAPDTAIEHVREPQA